MQGAYKLKDDQRLEHTTKLKLEASLPRQFRSATLWGGGSACSSCCCSSKDTSSAAVHALSRGCFPLAFCSAFRPTFAGVTRKTVLRLLYAPR